MRIGIFDLGSFFWTLAGARSKDEGGHGLALQVARYMRERGEKAELDAVLFASDGPPELPSRSWRLRVDPAYKGHRAPKDEAQREELVALVGALQSAGFAVVAAEEGSGKPDDRAWFEADDVAASAAVRVAKAGHIPVVFSTDWDLAQVLAYAPSVRIFTTRGEERTANDVLREFGVDPSKLADLKALAGDASDGYKPFPGEAPGKPGIGEKGAADLLKAFGSARSAMAAALSNLDSAFAEKGLPKRIPALLRAGGEAALERGLKLATLRVDAPVPDDFEVGDWEEVETALLTRKIDQERVASTRVVEAAVVEEHGVGCNGTLRNGPVTCPGGGVGCPGSSDEREIREERFGPKTSEILGGPSREPPVDRTAEKIVADVSAERAPQMTEVEKDHAVENLVELLAKENAKHEALPPETKAAMERASDRVIAALEQRDRMVILTEAEFMAVAMLPALHAAGLFDVPESASSLRALFSAIQKGEIRAAGRGLFIGRVVQETEEALTLLAGFFFDDQIREEHRALVGFLASLPNVSSLAGYGCKLARA